MDTTPHFPEPLITLAVLITTGLLIRIIVVLVRAVRATGTPRYRDVLFEALQAFAEIPALFYSNGRLFGGVQRIKAIAVNTCREAVRRKLLWLVPIWFALVLGIGRFLNPMDQEQDRYPLLIKLFLYSQLVVTVGAIGLVAVADIGNERRRKTLLTLLVKPVTRLEVVVGKTVGHSLTAAVLLAAMGGLTYAYFSVLDYRLRSDAGERFAELSKKFAEDPRVSAPDPALATLAEEGVLSVRHVRTPTEPMRIQSIEYDGVPWLRAGSGQRFLLTFPEIKPANELDPPKLIFRCRVVGMPPLLMKDHGAQMDAQGRVPLDIGFTALMYPKVDPKRRVTITYPLQVNEQNRPEIPGGVAEDERFRVTSRRIWVSLRGPEVFTLFAAFPVPNSMMMHQNEEGEWISPGPLTVEVTCDNWGLYMTPAPGGFGVIDVDPSSPTAKDGMLPPEGPARFLGHRLRGNQAIQGVGEEQDPTDPAPGPKNLYPPDQAIWEFPGIEADEIDPNFPAELRIKTLVDINEMEFAETRVRVNLRTADGKIEHTVDRRLEENRPLIVPIPESLLVGRPFRLTVTSRTTGHGVGFESALVATRRSGFLISLIRTQWIIWMTATVIAAVGLAAGAFLSWPVALMAMICMLALGPVKELVLPLGEGHEMWRMFGLMKPGENPEDFFNLVKWLVFALGHFVAMTAYLAPDLREFNEFEVISRGLAVPDLELLRDFLWAILYSLPFVMFGFFIMRTREAGE